jgi:acid-sensing ion channel, other
MTLKFPQDHGISVSTDSYPLKSSRYGQGLKITLKRNQAIDLKDVCFLPTFMVHSPHEHPGNFELIEMIQFDYGYDFEVLITPEIIKTDQDLESYAPEERGCYLKGEKKLKYFKVYTRRNCETECRINLFYGEPKLNCTPYFMVRSDSMDYCDYQKEYWVGFESYKVIYRTFGRTSMCGCLDECDSIKYKFEIIATNRVSINSSVQTAEGFDETSFEFKFKDVDIVPLRRYQSFTFSEFLAQSGGMLGLFAGISALSIIELLYFSSLRWMVNLWRWIKKGCSQS